MKLDLLAFGSHPDDVEISASGTLAKHIANGYKAGIVDLTRGELGTRGNAELRDEEARISSEILKLSARENLNLGDGFFEINEETLRAVIIMIRKYRPEIVLCNAAADRHPDHARGGDLVSRAAFLSGLLKIETQLGGRKQDHWRPRMVLRYIQDRHLDADIVVDITGFFEIKMKSILAFSSQFYKPGSNEPDTPISGKNFQEYIKSRAIYMGRVAGYDLAEGFTVERAPGVTDLLTLV